VAVHHAWPEISMPVGLDHLILPVADIEASVRFYYRTLRLKYEPVALLRVSEGLVLQLMQRPPTTSQHLAFSMSRSEFGETLERLKHAAVPYGDDFDRVGNMMGPGKAHGSRKNGNSVYFEDPDRHMLEIIYYDEAQAPGA
jgi:catechol 2,3-dioxygenase-like lactoylglutathione lyase family enzyme